MPTLPRMVQNELVDGRADYAPILRGDDLDWLMLCLQGITFTDAGESERVERIIDRMHNTHPIGNALEPAVRIVGHQAAPPVAQTYADLVDRVVAMADDPFGVVPTVVDVQLRPTLVIPGENQLEEIPIVLRRETATWLVRYLFQGEMVRGVDAHHRYKVVQAMERGVQQATFPYRGVEKMSKIACACGCGQTIMVSGQDVMFLQDENGEDRETFFLPGRFRICESDVWAAEWDAANADEPDIEPEYLA